MEPSIKPPLPQTPKSPTKKKNPKGYDKVDTLTQRPLPLERADDVIRSRRPMVGIPLQNEASLKRDPRLLRVSRAQTTIKCVRMFVGCPYESETTTGLEPGIVWDPLDRAL